MYLRMIRRERRLPQTPFTHHKDLTGIRGATSYCLTRPWGRFFLFPPLPIYPFIPPGIDVDDENGGFPAIAEHAHVAMIEAGDRHFLAMAPTRR